MWKQKILDLLAINQIDFVPIENQSIFELFFLSQHQLFLHFIDLSAFQENNIPLNYFKDFSDNFNAQNQRIIHLWEDVYCAKPELVESRILAIVGKFTRLHARHCLIERIDKPTADNFLETNHLQGSVKVKFKYGLFLKPQYVDRFIGNIFSLNDAVNSDNNFFKRTEPKLIAVATFSGGRTMKVGERAGTRSYELIRFASLQGFVVVGGMDKLLKAFTKEHEPDDIMSYIDRDWSDGKSYLKLGFLNMGALTPQCFLNDESIHQRLMTNENYYQMVNAGSFKFLKMLK
jgi:hypothetical protein